MFALAVISGLHRHDTHFKTTKSNIVLVFVICIKLPFNLRYDTCWNASNQLMFEIEMNHLLNA